MVNISLYPRESEARDGEKVNVSMSDQLAICQTATIDPQWESKCLSMPMSLSKGNWFIPMKMDYF